MGKRIYLSVFLICLITFCLAQKATAKIEPDKGDEMGQVSKAIKEESVNNPFGVLEFLHWNHPWNNYKYPNKESLEKIIALMKEAHVGWARIDFLWSDIEPQEGRFEFDKYDMIVNLLTQNNINVLGILDYSADWASSCGRWNCPPSDNKLFVNYAVKIIQRYKDKVKYWEIWNEPDSPVYWEVQDGLKSYCQFLKEVYIAAKKADPDCKILNGGLANSTTSINRLYDNGAKDYFDILNIHIFESPLNAGAVKRIAAYSKLAYKIMSRNGDSHKKIWVTEIGCPGVRRRIKTEKWWLGKNPTEKQQAKLVEATYSQLLGNKAVEKVFWAFFRDCHKHWGSGVDYFGLVRWNFSRKPSFFSYQKSYNNWNKTKEGSGKYY